MKIPQRLPDVREVIKKDPMVQSLLADPEMQKLVVKYDQDCLHRDGVRKS